MISFTPYRVLLLFLLALRAQLLFAQTDSFAGEWNLIRYPQTDSAVQMQLKVGVPEKNLLYPAEVNIFTQGKKFTYHLLLAKRDIRKVGIGHQIRADNGNDHPYLLKNFSGYLDLHRALNGSMEATLLRLQSVVENKAQYASFTPEGKRVYRMLSEENISLKKTSEIAWDNPKTVEILNANPDSAYYGIHDSLFVNHRFIRANFNFKKKTGNGTLTLLLNGSPVVDQVNLSVSKPEEDIRLDTGMNILLLFTDQFGKRPSSTGKLEIKTEKQVTSLDHKEAKDEEACFIAVRIFYESKEPTVEESIIQRQYQEQLNSPDNLSIHPDMLSKDSLGNIIPPRNRKQPEAELLRRNSQNAGSISVKAKRITLAIWDDALEDGDTISLRINDQWIVQNMAVKKKPQFLTVQVNPGPNKITFIAENLGAIIPNTSVLEINDGRQRKAFFIDTNLDTNNHVNIIYNPAEH